MKKILLVGKLNKAVSNLSDCLTDTFQVQVCSDSDDMIKEMIKISKPDLAIISLIEFTGEEKGVFDLFDQAFRQIPVVVVGNREECGKFQEYMDKDPFVKLLRPVSKDFLTKKCCEILGITTNGNSRGRNGEENTLGSGKAESGKKSILVVDDSALALRSMRTMLGEKYKVSVATSARRGMEAIQIKRPDLILLDYDMPECNGREMLKMIRQNPEIADIPVIFLTAVADKEHIMAVLQLNPNGYFKKPLERNMVMKAIAKVLGEDPEETA